MSGTGSTTVITQEYYWEDHQHLCNVDISQVDELPPRALVPLNNPLVIDLTAESAEVEEDKAEVVDLTLEDHMDIEMYEEDDISLAEPPAGLEVVFMGIMKWIDGILMVHCEYYDLYERAAGQVIKHDGWIAIHDLDLNGPGVQEWRMNGHWRKEE